MTTDQKLRDASASVREARRHANFTVETPTQHSTRSRFTVLVAAAALVLLVVGLPLLALRGFGQSGTVGGTSDTTTATSSPDATPVAPSEETPADTVPPASETVDITDLVVSAETSSDLPGFEAEYLIDGDLDRGWQDASLRGVGAEIVFTFDAPVAISELVIYPSSDTVRFRRNYKVQGYTVRVDDQSEAVVGRLQNSNQAQVVMVGSSATTVLTLSVTTTYPAEPVADKPPFDELAIAEIRVFGRTLDGARTADTATTSIAGSTTTVTGPVVDERSTRFESPVLEVSEGPFWWDAYISNAMSGDVPVVLRGQLARVTDEVMRDLGALPLEFSSDTYDPGVFEAATFLFQSGPATPLAASHGDLGISWIRIAVLWQEWDGRTEANPLGFPADAVREQWGGDSVFITIDVDSAEFGAINVGALKTVRFSAIDSEVLDSEGLDRFAINEEEMREIAASVFEVLKP